MCFAYADEKISEEEMSASFFKIDTRTDRHKKKRHMELWNVMRSGCNANSQK